MARSSIPPPVPAKPVAPKADEVSVRTLPRRPSPSPPALPAPAVAPPAIGLGGLPRQNMEFCKRKGGHFTIMVAGPAGCGKSTFLNTLFHTPLLAISQPPAPTTQVALHQFDLEEAGFVLRLTAIDTPGFARALDNTAAWHPLADVVDSRLRSYLFQAEQPDRSKKIDSRVHCCLYFIVATGRLTPLDLETLRELSARVNVIPVLSKCDSLSHHDFLRIKHEVRHALRAHAIPVCDLVSDAAVVDKINAAVPYGVMGASGAGYGAPGPLASSPAPVVPPNGPNGPASAAAVQPRGRNYKWGVAEVDNANHCDFGALKSVLLSDHMLDLVCSTDAHYENYRSRCLQQRYDQALATIPAPVVAVPNGLDQHSIYTHCTLAAFEGSLAAAHPKYEQLEQRARQDFESVIATQEKRFKGWKKALVEKQDAMNSEIQEVYKLFLAIQAEIETFQVNDNSSSVYSERFDRFAPLETSSLQEADPSLG